MFTRKRHLQTARWTLATFILNVLFPLFGTFAYADTLSSTAVDSELDPSGSIVFCTSQGIKLIDLASFEDGSYLSKLDSYPDIESADGHSDSSSHHMRIGCMLCIVSHMAFLPLDTHAWNQSFNPSTAILLPAKTVFKPSALTQRGWHSRAPPIFS